MISSVFSIIILRDLAQCFMYSFVSFSFWLRVILSVLNNV